MSADGKSHTVRRSTERISGFIFQISCDAVIGIKQTRLCKLICMFFFEVSAP